MFKKVLLALVVWVMGASAAVAQTTVTVYDGDASSNFVPIYGYYADSYLKCEYVIPAEMLGAEFKAGSEITSLKWFMKTPAGGSWGNANFQVLIKETSATTLSAYSCSEGATLVYEGAIDGTQAEIEIAFSTPYTYEGKNLIIGVYNTVKGDYKSSAFLGVAAEGVSIQGYNASSLESVTVNQRNFGPKTELTYNPGSGQVFNRPKNLVISEITTTSAKLTWEAGSDESSWKLSYKKKSEDEWSADIAVSEMSYTFSDLSLATEYDVRVKSVYAEGESSWATASFATTICDEADKGELFYELSDAYGDGWGGNLIKIVYHNTGMVVATLSLDSGSSASGSIKLCYDEDYDIVWVSSQYATECGFKLYYDGGTIIEHTAGVAPTAGVLKTFTFEFVTCSAPSALIAEDITWNSAMIKWPADRDKTWQLAYNTTPSFDPASAESTIISDLNLAETPLTNLNENTTYYVKVRANCGGEYSNWSDEISFTTPEHYPVPTNLQTTDLRAYSTKLAWKGEAETYNVRYRTAEKAVSGEVVFSEDFEGGALPEGWSVIDADGDGYNFGISTSVKTGSGDPTAFGTYCMASASYINGSGALTPDNWLITPQLDLDGTLHVFFCGQDAGFAAEHFAVYVSTSGKTVADFTTALIPETTAKGTPPTEYTADLSAYAGQKGYIAIRHFNCTDQYMLNVDNFSISAGDEIIPAGEWTTAENVSDKLNSEWWYYALSNLTPQTAYEAQVQANYEDDQSVWSPIYKFVTADEDAVPTGLEVNTIGDTYASAVWLGKQDKFNLRYRQPTSGEIFMKESFENSGLMPTGWTAIDSDGDGNNWMVFNPANMSGASLTAKDGSYVMMSRSWQSSALTPDNWLISPKVELEGALKYWILDDGQYKETYRIYVSTGGTDIADFQPLTDDLQSPGSSTWVERSVDLSEYAGQTGYIAFRNYNCTDQDYMFIDLVTIEGNVIEEHEWTVANNIESTSYKITGLTKSTEYEVQVQGVLENGTTTDWTESVKFTTLDKIYTLAELIESGIEGTPVNIAGELYFAAHTPLSIPGGSNPLTFITDGESWACTNAITATQATTYNYIIDAVGSISNVATMPQISFTDGWLYSGGDAPEIRTIDLAQPISELPVACEVAKVIAYYDGEKLCANAPGGEQSVTLAINTDMTNANMEVGKRYIVTLGFAVASTSNGSITLDASDELLSKYLGIVIDAVETSGVDGVIDDNNAAKTDVRYYDVSGRYIGKSINNASKGIYIGSDGSKTLKK